MPIDVLPRSKDWFQDHWNAGVSSGTSTVPTLIISSSKQGVNNPNWKKEVSDGRNATTPFTATRRWVSGCNEGEVFTSYDSWNCTGGFYHGPSVGWERGNLFGNFGFPTDPVGLDTTEADLEARINFFKQIRKARQSFQSGVFLGELAETLRMIRRPGASLRQLVTSYSANAKKRIAKEKTTASKKKALAGTWLEFSFGWKPLVQDVDNLAETLAEHGFNRDVIPVRAWGKRESLVPTSVIAGGLTISTNYSFQLGTSNLAYVRFLGAVSNEASTTKKEFRRWGLHPDDFVPTVYNLIPYSFLVDYFSNLGDLIDAVSVRNVQTAWMCQTVIKQAIRRPLFLRNDFKESACPANTVRTKIIQATASHSSFEIGWRHVARSTPLTPSISAGDFRLRIPGVESPWKWLNIAGLAALRR